MFPSTIPAPQPQAAAVIARPVAVSAVLPDRGDLAASAAKAAESHLLIAEAKSENIKWSRLGRIIQSMERLAQVAPYYLEPADVQTLQTAQAEAWARWREAGEGLFGSSLSGVEKALGGSSAADMASPAAMVVKADEASEAAAGGGKVRLLSAREDQIRAGDKVVFNSNGSRYAVTVKKLYADGTALVSHGWFPDFKDQYLPVSILTKQSSSKSQ